MDIKDVLTERASPILYHGTSKDKANRILKQQNFKLSEKQDQYVKNKKFPYYLSTARSPQSYYYSSKLFSAEVMFVLDGDWVNKQNYLIAGAIDIDNISRYYDYSSEKWKHDRPKNPYDPNVLKKIRSTKAKNINSEFIKYQNKLISKGMMEDRIWSREPWVSIDGFIKEIHLLKQNVSYRSIEKSIIEKSKELGIPTWYYKNSDDYSILNKNKANQVN